MIHSNLFTTLYARLPSRRLAQPVLLFLLFIVSPPRSFLCLLMQTVGISTRRSNQERAPALMVGRAR